MKEKVKLVVLIPVGGLSSKNRFEFIEDTIASVVHYATNDRKIVIQDNSSPLHLGDKLRERFPELIVVRAPRNYGMYGGLYKSLSLALLHIQAAYDFELLYKLDTDALLTGYGLEDDALDFFARHDNLGVIGTYCHAGESIDWPRRRLQHEISTLGLLLDYQRGATMRYLTQKARGNGYVDGEHILGGVAIYSPAFIDKLVREDLLLREEIRRSKLQEDHLSGLFCKVLGFQMADFSIPEQPFAVAYQGLPASPEDLAKLGAKAIHSTRFWQSRDEEDIRAFFRIRREVPVPVEA